MEQGTSEQPLSISDKNFSFTGNGGEYFKIWIVNILLSILTLGIYSAWAKVRNNRYFYGNTLLDGECFDYHATPMQILKGRIIAIVILAFVVFVNSLIPLAGAATSLIIMFATPWVIWNALKFSARMSSYRNVRFGLEGQLRKQWGQVSHFPLFG